MKKRTRRFFFYSLLAIFIIAAPFLLASSFGYTINFTTQAVESTGGIFIKSRIPRLSIFLNGAFIKETAFFSGGALLTDIPPGAHLVRLEKSGFIPWSKTVLVEPIRVSEFRNILLVPSPLPVATSTSEERSAIERAKKMPPVSEFKINKKGDLTETRGASTIVIAHNVHSFDVLDDALYYILNTGFLARLNLASRTIDTLGHPGFFLNERRVAFVRSPGGELALIDSSGGFFILENEKVKGIEGGVKKLFFDRWGDKVLLVKDQELAVYWVHENPYQPFQKQGTIEAVLQSPVPIVDARWYFRDNAHIVMNAREGVLFIETDGRGGRNSAQLLKERVDELITTTEITEAIFYKKGKTYFTITL